MAKIKTRQYSDIDLNFIEHPLTGDISKKYDAVAIGQALKNIIQYRLFEKPFDPDLHTSIRDLLFEPFSPRVSILIEKYTVEIIEKYEKRIQVLKTEVIASPTDQSYTLKLTYRPLNSAEPVTVDLYLTRVR